MTKHRFLLCFLILAAMASTLVVAQTTGQIMGKVTDEKGTPLPGVTIVATSPALMGERAVVSDGTGTYVLAALPSGIYSLWFSMPGFLKIQVSDVVVPLGQIVKQNVQLKSGEMVESVTVKATMPLIDRKTTDTSFNMGIDKLSAVPTAARSFRDLTKFVPSITSVDLNTTDGGRVGFPSIRGEGQYGDNYLVDGLTVRDPAVKTTATPVPYDSIKEVQIITDGFAPEYGQAAGGTVNVITRTGSNEFGGEVAALYTSDKLAAARKPIILATADKYTDTEPYMNVGGAILKDKLWYFGSYNRLDTTDEYAPVFKEGWGLLPAGKEKDKSNTYFGKLAWAINPNHTLSANYTYRDLTVTGLGAAEATPEARSGQDVKDDRLRVDYKALFTAKSVFELKYGYVKRDIKVVPLSPRENAQYELVDFGVVTNNAWRLSQDKRNRYDYATTYTQVWNPGGWLGSHEFKLGLEYHDVEQINFDQFTGTGEDVFADRFNGGVQYQIVGSGGFLVPSTLTEYLPAPALKNASKEKGFFLQDRWEMGDWNFMAGLRADNQRGFNDRNVVFYKTDYSDTISPRGSVTWDMTSDGVNIFKAAWGRFYDVQGTRFGEFANSRSGFSFRQYEWAGTCTGDFRSHIGDGGPCDLHNPANWAFVLEQSNASNPLDYSRVTQPGELERYLFEYDRQIGQNYAFKARYVNNKARKLVDDVQVTYGDWQVLNWDRKKRDYQSFELEFNGNPTPNISFNASYVRSASKGTNPGQFEASGFVGSSGSGFDIGVYGDRPPSSGRRFYQHLYGPNGVPGSWVGVPTRDYNNDDIINWKDLNYRLIKRTYAGLGGLDGEDGWYGYLPYSIDDQVKINANMKFPKLYDIYVNSFLSWASGYHTERRGFQIAYGDYLTFSRNLSGFSYVGACTSTADCVTVPYYNHVPGRNFDQGDGLKRGTLNNPSFWTLDMSVGKVWNLGGKFNLEARIDCFNVTNNQTIVAIQQRAVKEFDDPLLRLMARNFRGMLRFEF